MDIVERVISNVFSSTSGESDVLNAEDSEHISNLFLKVKKKLKMKCLNLTFVMIRTCFADMAVR